MSDRPSSDLSDNEAILLQQVTGLRNALATTLNYIQSELEPEPPASILAYTRLIEEAKPGADIGFDPIRELLEVVLAMTRFLSVTSASDMFSRYGATGLADWSILGALAIEPPGTTDRELCRLIGTNYKRMRRLLDSLAQAGLVAFVAPDRAGTPVTVTITDAGRARLDAMNAGLLPSLDMFLRRTPLRLVNLARSLRLVARLHAPSRKGTPTE